MIEFSYEKWEKKWIEIKVRPSHTTHWNSECYYINHEIPTIAEVSKSLSFSFEDFGMKIGVKNDIKFGIM